MENEGGTMESAASAAAPGAAPRGLAVLGGGMAALTAVYELTSQPDWQARHGTITVYQQGWRLGGKGASGRNMDPALGRRIEEHGLHLLFGCYENAFRILRGCYTELGNGPGGWPWQFDHAFRGEETQTLIEMYERVGNGWLPWAVRVPTRDGEPGVGDPQPWGARNVLGLLMAWVKSQTLHWNEVVESHAFVKKTLGATVEHHALLESAGAGDRAPVHEVDAALAALHHAAPAGHPAATEALALPAAGTYRKALDTLIDWTSRQQPLATGLRRAKIIIDLALRVSAGLLDDGVISLFSSREDWFSIDDLDLRAWLAKHDAAEETRNSAIVQGLYDSVFSWNAKLGAGTILHALIRASHYKGALFYRMQAGMGDCVFAPLYEVLRRRGVRFEFFHRVDELVLSGDRRSVQAIVIERQVRLKKDFYEPLVEAGGLGCCWPSTPKLDQIDDAQAAALAGHDLENWWDDWDGGETVRLERGKQFDEVLLGMSIGVFPHVCRQLIDDPGNPRFEEMVSSVETTATQAFQLWVDRDAKRLGIPTDGVRTVIPFAPAYDTWADMSHLIAREELPPAVKGIHYHCSSLDEVEAPAPRYDHEYPRRLRALVRDNAVRWLDGEVKHLWPGAATPAGTFDWNVLHDWNGSAGKSRFDAQHYCAVVHPSDRYVRATPRSNAKRLRGWQSGYDNVTLAGDWTKSAMSIGCLESATMSGIEAARCLDPRIAKAVYDWLPDRDETEAHATALLAATPQAAASTDAAVNAPGAAPLQYVRRTCEMMVPPPVSLVSNVYTFFVEADHDRLKELCARQLNLAPGLRYQPAGSFVVFYCARMDHETSAGDIDELDFGVWVPVFALDEHGNAAAAYTYTPFLWVDDSPSLVGGRSIYGFPKHVGKLSMPKVGDPARFELSTSVLLSRRASRGPLLTISRTDAPTWQPPGKRWDLGAIHDVLGVLKRFNPTTPRLSLLRDLLAPDAGMPMVFLKQFPEINGTWDACYQAITETHVDIIGDRDGGPLDGDYEVQLLRCASHRIVEQLGLRNPGGKPPRSRQDAAGSYDVLDAVLAGWMSFTATVKPGNVVWQART